MPQYGLLVYTARRGTFNVGDYIQSLAARRFLPHVDAWVNREALSGFAPAAPTRIILNGWFTHDPSSWPPCERIEPLITSFHVNESVRDAFTAPRSIEYLRQAAPVGCRDRHTLDLLRARGVDAYLSACLTLTLERPDFTPGGDARRRQGVYLVDPVPTLARWGRLLRTPLEFARAVKHRRFDQPARLRTIVRQLLAPDLLRQARWLEHELPATGRSHARRFSIARQRLGRYANAELVITSRLHCALPCLAFGTPVLFVVASTDDAVSACRFGGLLDLLNVVDVDPVRLTVSPRFDSRLPLKRGTLPPNPRDHFEYRDRLERICRAFIDSGRRDAPTAVDGHRR